MGQKSRPAEAEDSRNPFCHALGSASPQDRVDHPAAEDMAFWLAAVSQDVDVVAPSVFEGVGENRHTVEGTLVVAGLGDLDHAAVVPCQPGRLNDRRSKGIAEEFPQDSGMFSSF